MTVPIRAACSPPGTARSAETTASASSGAVTASIRPSHAQYSGSRPSRSQAASTGGSTGTALSSISTDSPVPSTNSLSVVAMPPLVGSRRMRIRPDSSAARLSSVSGRQSDSRDPPCASPARAIITAAPWHPALPLRITASPARMASFPRPGARRKPIPAVLM